MIATTGSGSIDIDIILTFLGAVMATASGLYIGVIAPAKRAKKDLEDAAKIEMEVQTRWYRGQQLPDGTIVPGAPEKLHDVQVALEANTTETKRLAEWQRQANGTTKSILAKVDDLTDLVKSVVATSTQVRLDLDTDAKHVATIHHDSQEALLHAIHEHDPK